MSVARLIPPDTEVVADLGPVRLRHKLGADLFDSGSYFAEHTCRTIHYDDGSDPPDVTIVCAPSLALHTIVAVDPYTITASVACRDCGLHGHVTAGAWVPC